jgi:hypothetical protein
VAAVLAELVDQLSQRAVGEAELGSDVLGCASFDKHGAESLVAAVIRIGWLSEEVATSGVVHDLYSPKMSVGFLGTNRVSW